MLTLKILVYTTVIFFVSLFIVNISAYLITPQIEKYSQGAAIEFYNYIQNKDCYVETYGYKSYANLFYSNKKQPTNSNSLNIDWLLRGPIDKPAYFVIKITDLADAQKDYPELKEIYRKNGFVFLMRLPSANKL